MSPSLDIEALKQNSLAFVQLLGNDHDTTSERIIGLLAEDFAVQHGELPPSEGGRDAFLNKLGDRLKLAKGHASVEVKHVIAEVCQSEHSKKVRSKDFIRVSSNGLSNLCLGYRRMLRIYLGRKVSHSI
ncbi:uncharacterized protein N7511_002959 [Penicillium nucicola]|uniref:uncharacterized protein n=1 Tax=Penicillium nucicola TaxID=1850975 RepID=UPI002544FE20|nr:uncharacterized protein N7511_002959 [Penicillium nucicola]KAJ5770908.1 hypothetical protein N7511_002959 [Penicillium nucicola]